jgi:hypothetical protein
MAKSGPNLSPAQSVEDGAFPEFMVSIVNGNGTADVPCVAYANGPAGTVRQVSGKSALIACIQLDATSGLPKYDFVDSAQPTDAGTLRPGKNLGSDLAIVYWWHYPNDDDPVIGAYSWVGGCRKQGLRT